MSKLLLTCFTLMFPLSLLADSGLGLNTAQLRGAAHGKTQSVDLMLDYAITAHHGVQLDVGASNRPQVWDGQIAGHLYMEPNERAKYGLFGMFMDENARAQYLAALGVEGQWQIDAGHLSGRAGLGIYGPDSRDFIFAELGLSRAVGRAIKGFAEVSAYELQEHNITSRDAQMRFGLTTASAPLAYSTFLSHSVDTGKTQLGASVTYTFNQRSGFALFTPIRPLTALLERGLTP